MPMSFGLALAQQPKARKRFTEMTDEEKSQTIDRAKAIKNKKEMWSFVTQLAQN